MGNGSYNFLLVTHIVSDPFHVSSQTHHKRPVRHQLDMQKQW